MDVLLGQQAFRQRHLLNQADLVTAQAEEGVHEEPEWYMNMTESKHLDRGVILRTKKEWNEGVTPEKKRPNPWSVIQQIKKARTNKSTIGLTTNAQVPTQMTEEWDDDKVFAQILPVSKEPTATPALSLPNIQETNTPTLTSSLVVLLEAIQEACAVALRSFKQVQSK